MDEPTAALGVNRISKGFRLSSTIKRKGVVQSLSLAINLRHVFSIADRIVVLRGGRER